MTRRQRVLAAIEHKTADRMPIDLGVHFSTSISAFAYRDLREYLGLSTDRIVISDPFQMLARVDEDILQRFHCDCLLLNPSWKNPKRWDVRGKYSFLTSDKLQLVLNEEGDWFARRDGKQTRMPVGGYFFDGEGVSADDYNGPEERMRAYAARAEWIYKETDYFTMQMGFSGFFGGLDFACDVLTEPEEMLEKQKQALALQLSRIQKVIETYGRYIQSIEVNSDLGMQSAPYLRPESYEKFCMPYLKKFCSFVHANSDIKIFMHSCGSINPLIPYIIEAGVDILNPVQISASNMNPQELKSKYGDKICFWGGGCDTQTVLPWAEPEEVSRHVKGLVDTFKPNGGYVFNQVHNIMGNIRPENIVAMLDTAYENSFY